jgi:hypothetical protein
MTIADERLPLSSGRACTLRSRPLPLLPTYHVLFLASEDREPTAGEEHEMFGLAHDAAARLGQRFFGDPGCYTIVFSGGQTRRRPWPHFHIVAVRGIAEKRRALLLLMIKRVLIAVQAVGRAVGGALEKVASHG